MTDTSRKIEDYINIQTNQPPEQLIQDYKTEIAIWSSQLKDLQERIFETHFNSSAKDVQEVMAARRFLSQYVEQRIEEISQMEKDIQLKYLQVLPPFHSKGGVIGLLGHFFELQANKEAQKISFKTKTVAEKELSILLDMYKTKRTIETIQVLEKALRSSDSFPSIFTREQQFETIKSLKNVFKVLFQMCIQPQFQQELYSGISKKHLSDAEVLRRQEQNIALVYPHVVKKYDYRIQYFLVYFKEGLKAKIRGEVKEFRYNYLNFEIMKQEFLVDWLDKNLKDNPAKYKVYEKYVVDGNNMAEYVQKHPDKERELMLRLPIEVFNDIAEEVSLAVAKDLKTGINVESENHGEFAETLKTFSRAKEAAKLSIEKLKLFVSGKSSPEPEVETTSTDSEAASDVSNIEDMETEDEPIITLLKKNEVDYPYFQREVTKYPQQLALLRVKMGPEFKAFNNKVIKKLSKTSESAMIRRRTPKHEWVMPFHIDSYKNGKEHTELLIIGAEVKAKQLGMGYSGNVDQQYQFTSYFIYAAKETAIDFGKTTDTRKVRNEELPQWDFSNPNVQERVLQLLKLIVSN